MAKVFFISKENIRDAWLTAVAKVLFEGDEIKTEYDKPDDLPSKDASVMIHVRNPMSKPIKRRDKIIKIKSKFGNRYKVFGCLADTYLIGSIQSGYIEEIMEGINDHYLWESGVSFPYSYHNRIFSYVPFSLEDTIHKTYDVNFYDKNFIKNHQKLIKAMKIKDKGDSVIWKLKNGLEFDLDKDITEQIGIDKIPMGILKFPEVNQMRFIIKKLEETPYTRRAQAITWRPLIDPYHDDPPCLQRIWMRIKNDELIMQTTWRSRDLLRAWEANVNGMVRFQKMVADELKVKMGHYLDFSNSLHIYGVCRDEVKEMFDRLQQRDEALPREVEELLQKN